MLEVDIPDVLAELEAAFEAYGRALTGNEIELSGARLAGTSAVAANAHQTSATMEATTKIARHEPASRAV